MTKADLTRNKNGRIVSKKQSALAKQRFATTVGPWMKAVKKARAALKLKCPASSGTSASSRCGAFYTC